MLQSTGSQSQTRLSDQMITLGGALARREGQEEGQGIGSADSLPLSCPVLLPCRWPSFLSQHLPSSALTFLPLLLVPKDKDGFGDTLSLGLSFHTCHAFLTSPFFFFFFFFLNKRMSL